MNGEFHELYTKLSVKLAEVDTRNKERWDGHDKRAELLVIEVNDLNKNVNGVKLLLGKRAWMARAIYGLYSWLGVLTVGTLLYAIKEIGIK